MKHANDVITKKYGDKALSDIDHYQKESERKFQSFAQGTLTALSVAFIGAVVANKISSSKNRQRNVARDVHDYVRNSNRF